MTIQAGGLVLNGLRVDLKGVGAIVEDVAFELHPAKILGLVGESGSGKTTTALALFGYTQPGLEIVNIELTVASNVFKTSEDVHSARGRSISYVPQSPSRALNPSMRIGEAIADYVAQGSSIQDGGRVAQLLLTVGLPDSKDFKRRYPHQLSGGQQQRVCIGLALACEPAVVVLDEPTTGLDVVTQDRIISELLKLRDEGQVSMVYVSHDLAVVARIADRIAVMYAGRIVEEGPVSDILTTPRHPYTRGLIDSIPDHLRPRQLMPMPGIAIGIGDRPNGCAFAPRCPQRTDECEEAMPQLVEVEAGWKVRCIHWKQTPTTERPDLALQERSANLTNDPVLEVRSLRAEHRSRHETVIAANDISFTISKGACVALVGESGSGKSTIARALAGAHLHPSGSIRLNGAELPWAARARSVEQRRQIQIVFQDPEDALNPRQTVAEAVARPIHLFRKMNKRDTKTEVTRLLECVRLGHAMASRYPKELSGGERQRVAIARALAAAPELIICDEITSSLDVSVQAAILTTLADLRRELGLSLLFISHDIGVVATVADEILVLEKGIVCESGEASKILRSPEHPYTQQLVAAAPSLSGVRSQWANGLPR